MTPPPTDPKQTPTDEDVQAERPDGMEIEELNWQTQPKGPGGEVVDPHQDQDPQTAG